MMTGIRGRWFLSALALVGGFAVTACGASDEAGETAEAVTADSAAAGGEASTSVADGGVLADGWQGRVDAGEAEDGMTISNARFASEGDGFRVTTGPASTYWNPANRATGNYTVRATFTESEYMGLNDHPHPYGVVVAGNELGTANESFLYCAAYGNGNFIVRGFGPEPFALNGNRGAAHEAVHRAAGPGQPVTQEIAVRVTADNVECIINGTTVGTYPKSEVVTAGRLTSTDGVYGVRFGHNTDASVTGLTMTQE